MRTKVIKRVLSILVLTMVATSMVFTTPVSAVAATDAVKALYEYGNRVQARYADPQLDIAVDGQVYTSSGENAAKIIDGWTGDRSFWESDGIANSTTGHTQEIQLVLDRYYYVDTIVLKGGCPISTDAAKLQYRPRTCIIQYMNESGNWVTIRERQGCQYGDFVYEYLSTPIIAKRFRFIFTEGALIDSKVRVAEILLYSPGYIGQPGDILTTETSTPDHSATATSSMTAVEADGKRNAVVTTPMDKWNTGYDQVTVLRVKNATWDMGQGAANYAYSKLGVPYNYNFFNYKKTSSFYCNQLSYRCWRNNGVSPVYLDSALTVAPITVGDLRADNDTYVVYERNNGIPAPNVPNW